MQKLAGTAFNLLRQTGPLCLPSLRIPLVANIRPLVQERCFSFLSRQSLIPKILATFTPVFNSVCGMKVKGRLRLRCKDCYFVTRQETLYVMCKTFGRHKQRQMKKKAKNTWILTHATQSKVRPW